MTSKPLHSRLLISVLSCLLCNTFSLEASIESEPLSSRPSDPLTKLFRKMPPHETGISFQNLLKEENIVKYLYNGAGVCVGDYDNDGFADIYLISQDGKNKLFRQTAVWQFNDVTNQAGVAGGKNTWGRGASFVDIDNDYDLDLYVVNSGSPNLLYINQGDGTFVEEAAKWKLDYNGASVMASFADYDRDGDVDCYLLTYRLFDLPHTHPQIDLRKRDKKFSVPPEYVGEYYLLDGHIEEAGRRDRLFRNNGNGTFTDVSYVSDIGQDFNHGLSATWFDYNNDNWPDLYVANDFKGPDNLYCNNGDGTFTDVIKSSVAYTSWFGMGSDFGDLNNDSHFDLLVADMSATNHYKEKTMMGVMSDNRWFLESAEPRQYMRNTLQLNTGIGRFMEIGYLAGVASTDWSWSTNIADLDNDGFEDVFFTNGIERNFNDSDHGIEFKKLMKQGKVEEARRLSLALPRLKEMNRVFRNQGDLTFIDLSEEWGLDGRFVSHGAVFADLDRDGDLDLVVNNMNDPVSIYQNTGNTGRSILIRLRGKKSNSFGVGSRLTAITAGKVQSRILSLARGYLGGNEPMIHFGFARESVIEQLIVEWPSGAKQEFQNLSTGQFYTISEPEGDFSPKKPQKQLITGHFAEVTDELGLHHRHQENEFDDYQSQALLPFRMSRLGPGMAWGDSDGDGDEDLYVGGALGQAGALYLQQAHGKFEPLQQGPWEADIDYEDMGVLWFDAEGDGDLDLYVVSGGYEREHGSAELRDRLYLNNGGNQFKKAPKDCLPLFGDSGSVVAGADFDRDGDVDLFVGSRLIPKRYPLSSRSHLLINSKGRFEENPDHRASGLFECGAVTGAVWSDIDNDGWIDLLITAEWGSIKIFKNREGHLLEETESRNLAGTKGFWNGIAAGDIDNDGDIDFVATNLGKNSKYKVHVDHPLHLFASDFDNNGILDLVEATWEETILYPVRGRSCSADAMPFVGQKFKTYDAFARASVEQVYTASCLTQAIEFTVNDLESSVFINDGTGKFEVTPLPLLAQVAPAYGVVLDDFNGDGNLDIVLAQNSYAPQPETGRLSGGLSLLLQGIGNGTFEPVWPKESGISIPDDAKSLVLRDIDGDRVNDLVFAMNNGPLKVYKNAMQTQGSVIALKLIGGVGNPQAFGAKVILNTTRKRKIHREIYGGSGYLSQSSAQINVPFMKNEAIESLDVYWPDGKKSQFDTIPETNVITLRHPSIKLVSAAEM